MTATAVDMREYFRNVAQFNLGNRGNYMYSYLGAVLLSRLV